MTMYESMFNQIRAVEVVRQGQVSVWVKDGEQIHRRHRMSDFRSYHPTWEAAKQHIIAKAQAEVERAESRLNYYRDALNRAQKITMPPVMREGTV